MLDGRPRGDGALGVPLVVNDRPDLAVLAGADAIHVGPGRPPGRGGTTVRPPGRPVDARVRRDRRLDRRLPRRRARPRDARRRRAARRSGSSSSATPPRSARAPWFAIGGIDATNVADVVAAGATRIAVVRAIGDAPEPEAAARELRAALGASRRAGRAASRRRHASLGCEAGRRSLRPDDDALDRALQRCRSDRLGWSHRPPCVPRPRRPARRP